MLKRIKQYLRIRRLGNLIYRFKYHVLKIPIVWYTGRNKGLFVLTGKPDFNRPLIWTKHVLKGRKYTKKEVKR